MYPQPGLVASKAVHQHTGVKWGGTTGRLVMTGTQHVFKNRVKLAGETEFQTDHTAPPADLATSGLI